MPDPTPTPTPTPTADPPSPPSDPTADLGDAGKKALDDERTARKAAEKAQRDSATRLAELEKRLADIDEANKSEHEKALEAARKEATDTATAEATTKANRRIVRSELKAAAGPLLHDPNDAVAHIDLDQFSVDDDGEIDAKALKKAVDDLLKEKPYLGANARKPPPPSADGGARPPGSATPTTARELITAGLEANEAARSRR